MVVRKQISEKVQTQLLVESRRKCCMCAFLDGDWSEKRVQIAHISRDSSDSSLDNLVLLCLNHHNEYDSSFKQTKNYTPKEIKFYKQKLVETIKKWDQSAHQLISPNQFSDSLRNSEFAGFNKQVPLGDTVKTVKIDPFSIASNLNSTDEQIISTQIDELHQSEILSEEITEVGSVYIYAVNIMGYNSHSILKISDKSEWKWQVIFFMNIDQGWRMLKHFYFGWQKSAEPKTFFISGRNSNLLGIEYLVGTGTGFYERSMTLYRVDSDKVTPILTFPTYAYVSGWYGLIIQRFISCNIESMPYSIYEGAKLKISVQMEYKADRWEGLEAFDGVFLFEINKSLTFIWDEDVKMFVPDSDSEVTFEYIEGFLGDNVNVFLKKYNDQIKRLAKEGNEVQKKFIAFLLDKYTNIEQLSEIQTLLDKS